jgi:DNA-binding transcriptional MerR regulator
VSVYLVPVSEAAVIIRVPARTIRRWITDGLVAAPRRGGIAHVSPAQLDTLATHWHAKGTKRRARPASLP